MNSPGKLIVPDSRPLQPVTQQSALLAIIARAAANPEVNIDKMERLLVMQQGIVDRDNETAFNAAMTQAQMEMGRISVDAENTQTRSKYATYAKLDRALRPIYTKHGFALSFDEGDTEKPEYVRVLCYVSHAQGFRRTYHRDMPADGKGAKGGDVMTKTHAAGAAQSYGMRYLLKAIFNVAVGEEDKDGNDTAELITEVQVAEIEKLITEVKAKREAFMGYYKIKQLSDIRADAFEAIKAALIAKRKKA